MRPRLAELFGTDQKRVTLLLMTAYFLHVMTNYFVLKWVPKMALDMGFSAAAGVNLLVLVNAGGVVGCFLLSFLSLRIDIRHLVFVAMLATAATLILFGLAPRDPSTLSVILVLLGFASSAAVVGLYPIISRSYPTALRATGAGFIVGFGRIGSALGPVAAGVLFSLSAGIPGVAAMMALGSLLAALALTRLFGSPLDRV